MKIKILLLFLFVFVFSFVKAGDTVDVRIFTETELKSFRFIPLSNSYDVYSDTAKVYTIAANDTLVLKYESDSIHLYYHKKTLGIYGYLRFQKKGYINNFCIIPVPARKKNPSFDDNLLVFLRNKKMILVNRVALDSYVAGVSEAESGTQASAEYYKMQSVLARTFVLGHMNRHEKDGYNLCSSTHCQAFNGRPKSIKVLTATISTKGMVVVDDSNHLITAAYHANCGGMTANCEDVWSQPVSYLRSVKDTFCLKSPSAKWEKKMPLAEWKSILKKKYNFSFPDSVKNDTLYCFKQPVRKLYLYENPKIPLKKVRPDLGLKSTFFEVEVNGDQVILKGRGFGHGLGMCQEGAMQMAKKGMTFLQIITFYFPGTKVIILDSK
ncbi:MAG: SpoIID/LytB domain-containing protein [Bacteroidota bacterium]